MSGSDPRHGSWERSIEKSAIVDDTDSVLSYSGLSDFEKEQYHSVLQKINREEPLGKDETLKMACIGRPSRWSSPSIDLNIAYKVCLRAAQSVFSSTTPPKEIQEKIEKSSIIMEKMLSKRFFQFAWYFLLIAVLVSVVPLFANNTALSFLILMALLFLETYSVRMFFLKGLSAFKKVKSFRSIINAGILMFILLFVVSAYAMVIITSGDLVSKASVLVAVSSLVGQIGLQFSWLNGKIKVHELSTYLDWFNDPEESTKAEKPLESAHPVYEKQKTPSPSTIMGYEIFHPKYPDLIYCPKCRTSYYQSNESKSCPKCGTKRPE